MHEITNVVRYWMLVIETNNLISLTTFGSAEDSWNLIACAVGNCGFVLIASGFYLPEIIYFLWNCEPSENGLSLLCML